MTVEVGFVGAGGIARAHLANLRRMDDVAVRAVSDVDAQRAGEVAGEWDATAYVECAAMLEKERLDAAYICLPPAMHGSLEIELAHLGIPFYIEKPLHLDLMIAAEVERAIQENGLITSVGYQLRYSDAVRAAQAYLADRQIALAQGHYIGGLPGAPWWRRKELSGGQVVEQSTHIFDLLRYLAGEVETVHAFACTGAMTDVEDYDVEDASVVALKFCNGAVGHVVSSCVLTDGGDRHVGIRLDGRSYTLKLTDDSLHTSDDSEQREESFEGPAGGWMGRADRTFIEAVLSGDGSAILSDYADSLRTLALTLAVEKSLSTGQPIGAAELLLAASH